MSFGGGGKQGEIWNKKNIKMRKRKEKERKGVKRSEHILKGKECTMSKCCCIIRGGNRLFFIFGGGGSIWFSYFLIQVRHIDRPKIVNNSGSGETFCSSWKKAIFPWSRGGSQWNRWWHLQYYRYSYWHESWRRGGLLWSCGGSS
jgi:hypothetical protein